MHIFYSSYASWASQALTTPSSTCIVRGHRMCLHDVSLPPCIMSKLRECTQRGVTFSSHAIAAEVALTTWNENKMITCTNASRKHMETHSSSHSIMECELEWVQIAHMHNTGCHAWPSVGRNNPTVSVRGNVRKPVPILFICIWKVQNVKVKERAGHCEFQGHPNQSNPTA